MDMDLILGKAYDPHDTIILFYDISVNRFIDMFGEVIHDIHRLLSPSQIILFKKEEIDMTFPDVSNSFLIELVYPDYLYTKHS